MLPRASRLDISAGDASGIVTVKLPILYDML